MKRFLLVSLLSVIVGVLFAQDYSLSDIMNNKFGQRSVSEYVSSADGLYYYQAKEKNSLVVKYSFATGQPVDTLFNAKTSRDCSFSAFDGFVVSPDENRVLLYLDTESIYRRSFKATYFYHDVRRNLVRKLTENKSKQMIPVFSPDSKMLAYVCDNNIWLAKFDFDTESQITKDGEQNKIINGATDWVYEEEFSTTCLMSFSPDNRLLAFVRTDESQVKQYRFQTYNGQLYPNFYEYKYVKPGEISSTVDCRVFDIDSKTTRVMDVPLDKDGYIPQIVFTPSAQDLAVMTLNRNQNRFDLYFCNPRSTVAKLILRDENKYYISDDCIRAIRFLPDRFIYLSEKSGYSHINIYGNSGTLQKQLTSGNFDVTKILEVDAQSGNIYYEAADEVPMRRNIFKINIEKGSPIKLSSRSGMNSASFSKNGKFFVCKNTDLNTPLFITLNDNNGKQLRVLEDNKDAQNSFASTHLPHKEFITLPAADGTTQLNGWILKPKNFDHNKKYPIVLIQYSGPNSQEVLDQYRVDWYYCLLNEDILVACVDGRGTGARGEEFRKQTYMNLGIKESDDQIAAAHYFGSLPYVDADRIGIWGWSFGGYNVLMSMSRGNHAFKAGVAIAPVTDWRFYDSVYTERFMRTPQQNKSGYDNTSALLLADKLQGNLLLMHGTADDNVQIQQSIEYSRALIRANKQFDMFYYPDKNHSIYGENVRSYLFKKVIDFYKRNL